MSSVCYHGGAFFEAVGEEFDGLWRFADIVNADVLDAWFEPSPLVLGAIRDHLPWLSRTSPPTNCSGLLECIGRARGVHPSSLLAGGGSSDLIFLALTRWLNPASRVLILDPMYGEYAHVLENVLRCKVDRMTLSRAAAYRLDPFALLDRVERARYDLVILVNPNSPTGQHVRRDAMQEVLGLIAQRTRVWIDETYVEYAGEVQSLEQFAAATSDVVVCKSMSKVYALSGLRVGYLCATASLIDDLRSFNPPWAVSLLAQVAAVRALEDRRYYENRWAETHALRDALARSIAALGIKVVPGVANFLLCHLDPLGPTAAQVVEHARENGVFVRDVGSMGRQLGQHALRIAVKDTRANERIVSALSDAIQRETASRFSVAAQELARPR